MAQEHAGSGDNVQRDKIDRQINMGDDSTYNEHNYYGASLNSKPLHIMVASKIINEITQSNDFSTIKSFYGKSMREWRPFKDENIEQILEDFQKQTKFYFTEVSYLDECNDADDYLDDFKKETIFILDGLTSCDFSRNLDSTHDEIAGFIILTNHFYDDNLIAISKQCFKNKWKKYYERITKHCLNIEICVNSKELLFRRLTNFAKLKGIEFSRSRTQLLLSQNYANSGADSLDLMGTNR